MSRGDNTFGSVRPSVRLSVYALTFDTWNTVQDLCVFVSNQGAFPIKSLAPAVDQV